LPEPSSSSIGFFLLIAYYINSVLLHMLEEAELTS